MEMRNSPLYISKSFEFIREKFPDKTQTHLVLSPSYAT